MVLEGGEKPKGPTHNFVKEPRLIEGADAYERLGVERKATSEEISSAFRYLASKYHPNASGGGNEATMKLITEAYANLRSEKRVAYDQTLSLHPDNKTPSRRSARSSSLNLNEIFRTVKRVYPDTTLNEMFSGRATEKSQMSMKERATIAAAKGPGNFMALIDNETGKGNFEVQELISDADVLNAIKKSAVKEVAVSFNRYDTFIWGWQNVFGFDRNSIDKSPEIYEAVVSTAIDAARQGPSYFHERLVGWRSLDEKLSLPALALHPPVAAIILEGLKTASKRGSEARAVYISRWEAFAKVKFKNPR